MAIADSVVTDNFAAYNGDCMEVLPKIPTGSVHMSIYSPPFATERGGALYHYSSSERDLSNSDSYAQFFEQYGFILTELTRATMPGRLSYVHCADVPTGNSGGDGYADFPGDLIRHHRDYGWSYVARYHVWKEPLGVRNRTLKKDLAHRTVVDDSTRCSVASADYLLVFRAPGENPVPVEHPAGLLDYAGSRPIPADLHRYRGWTGKQTENRYSHWIWRQYASAFWDDVRLDRVLPFREARAEEDEKHCHPLQLDVIDRAMVLGSNPGETVFTPFMGVGSEVFGAVSAGRRGVGVELKPTYYRQAVANLRSIEFSEAESMSLFGSPTEDDDDGRRYPLPA